MFGKAQRKQGRFHKLRENHRVTCLPKIGHDTEEEAQAHIDSLVANGKAMPGALTIYRCLECHKLHVGHKPVMAIVRPVDVTRNS